MLTVMILVSVVGLFSLAMTYSMSGNIIEGALLTSVACMIFSLVIIVVTAIGHVRRPTHLTPASSYGTTLIIDAASLAIWPYSSDPVTVKASAGGCRFVPGTTMTLKEVVSSVTPGSVALKPLHPAISGIQTGYAAVSVRNPASCVTEVMMPAALPIPVETAKP